MKRCGHLIAPSRSQGPSSAAQPQLILKAKLCGNDQSGMNTIRDPRHVPEAYRNRTSVAMTQDASSAEVHYRRDYICRQPGAACTMDGRRLLTMRHPGTGHPKGARVFSSLGLAAARDRPRPGPFTPRAPGLSPGRSPGICCAGRPRLVIGQGRQRRIRFPNAPAPPIERLCYLARSGLVNALATSPSTPASPSALGSPPQLRSAARSSAVSIWSAYP